MSDQHMRMTMQVISEQLIFPPKPPTNKEILLNFHPAVKKSLLKSLFEVIPGKNTDIMYNCLVNIPSIVNEPFRQSSQSGRSREDLSLRKPIADKIERNFPSDSTGSSFYTRKIHLNVKLFHVSTCLVVSCNFLCIK